MPGNSQEERAQWGEHEKHDWRFRLHGEMCFVTFCAGKCETWLGGDDPTKYESKFMDPTPSCGTSPACFREKGNIRDVSETGFDYFVVGRTPPPIAKCAVILYDGCLGGHEVTLYPGSEWGTGEHDLHGLGIGDMVASMKVVGKNCHVTLWEEGLNAEQLATRNGMEKGLAQTGSGPGSLGIEHLPDLYRQLGRGHAWIFEEGEFDCGTFEKRAIKNAASYLQVQVGPPVEGWMPPVPPEEGHKSCGVCAGGSSVPVPPVAGTCERGTIMVSSEVVRTLQASGIQPRMVDCA